MRASQARYVTACQQLLALGLVLAALTPAAGVVSLDVVGTPTAPDAAPLALSAYTGPSSRAGTVATAPVDPHVAAVQLTAPRGSRTAMSRPLQARSLLLARRGLTRVVSAPQRVLGYGTVGVTWDPRDRVADGAISLEARTRTDGRWSGWTDIAYDADHGPDPGSAEARHSRPGTDALLIGRVGRVQVRSTSTAPAPADMQLAVIDPGAGKVTTTTARPAINTASLPSGQALRSASAGVSEGAAAYTPMPSIFSRAQWGADENMRDAGSLRYYEVHAGFVHHTVNANDYSEADVPALLRSIYAYHTRSRGWSDIGYNFLVDRFGRVWEGRYGGVDRPVVGAHTLGYNEYSFAMSAIGNFETVQPSDAVLQAYGAVFAWKLALHGVDASSPAQVVGSKTFQAINGHRDAGQTACPGKYLYAQIPLIRQYAAAGQVGWAGRELESNLAGSPHPDIVVRRAADGQGFVVPTQGSGQPLGAPVDTGQNLADADTLLNVGDWDRDGFGDFMVRRTSDKALYLYRGNGLGGFAAPVLVGTAFAGVRLLAAVGDVTGDGWPDLMGQPRKSAMRIYPGVGVAGFAASYVAYSKVKANRQVGIGRMDADGAPDSIFRKKKNLVLYRGNGPGGLTAPATQVRGRLAGFDWTIGISDLDLSGHSDVLIRKKKTGQLFVLPGNEKRFGKPVLLGDGMGIYDLAD